MALVINDAISDVGSPYVLYDLEATYRNRTKTTVIIDYTITGWLQYGESSLLTGYSITPTVYFGDDSEALTLKTTSESWRGTTKHSKTGSIKVEGLSATTKSIYTGLSVAATDSGRMGKKAGTRLTIPDFNDQSAWAVNTRDLTLDTTGLTITITPVQSTNQHRIQAVDGTKKVTIVSKSSGTTKKVTFDSATFGPWFSATSKTKIIKLELTTYDSTGASLGTSESAGDFTLTMPASVGSPTGAGVSLLNLTDIGAIFKVTRPSYKYGATYKSFSLLVSSGTATYDGLETITHVADPNVDGEVTIPLLFTDSRGFISNVATVAYTPELTKFLVRANGEWKKAMPYVFTNGIWKKAIGYIYNGGVWKK